VHRERRRGAQLRQQLDEAREQQGLAATERDLEGAGLGQAAQQRRRRRDGPPAVSRRVA
jgi:hypothetical protein